MEAEEEVQKALVAGNYELAVEACFKANRLADALLIANIFNSELYKRTMHRYMKRHPKPYMQIVRANVEQDWASLVRSRPVGQWRETLALLATYTAQDDWTTLCDMLATRLSAAAMHHAASLCYICAGNLDQAVAFWSKGATVSKDAMQAVIEKSVIFGLATGTRKGSAALSDLVTAYASLLASQGRLTNALEYLEYVPGEASTTVAVLKDRIFRSGAPLPQGVHSPPFPFILEDVRPVAAEPAKPAYNAAASTGQYNGVAQQQQPQQQQWGYAGQQQQPAYGQQAAYAAQPQQPQAAYAQQPAAYSQPVTGYGQPAGGYGGAQRQATPAAAPQAAAQPYGVYGGGAAAASTTSAWPGQSGATGYGATTGAGGYGGGGFDAAGAGGGAMAPGPYVAKKPAPPPVSTSNTVAADGGAGKSNMYATSNMYANPAPVTGPPAGYGGAGAPGGAQPFGGPTQPYGSAAAATPAAPPPASTTARFTPTTTDASSRPVPVVATGAPGHAPPPLAAGGGGGYAGYGAAPGPVGGPQAGAYSGAGYPGAAAPAPVAAPAAPAAPPPPAGPPANTSIATVDTSAVPAEYRSIVTSLTALYNSCVPLANNPMKKREMEDNTRKVGQLFWRLNANQVSASVLPKLQQLCAAIDSGDMHTANHLQVQMTTTDWDECGFWLGAVKRLIKLRTQPAT